jgi:transcriptional regulator with XRE-family HTH domain
MPIYFSNNLKLLRNRKKLSQEELGKAVDLKRHDIDNYERGIAPPPENMIAISDLFKISVDTMLRIDLNALSQFNLQQLELGHDSYVRGTKLRVHATTVDSNNKENVELVAYKARAGYTAGYNDPEFVSGLPTFQLPFLSRDKKYRMFQIDGDSMLPIPDKSYVIGEFVQNWHDIKDGYAYVLLTREEGVVFKIVYNEIRKKKNILLRSLNVKYKPYSIPINEILEVWKFVNYVSSEIQNPNSQNNLLIEKVEELRELIMK